jgi:pimeloyl-ACP methyl ester carboxylesterase
LRRKTVVAAAVGLSALGLLAGFSTSATAKVKKGPAGLAFYAPPKKLPKQHGTLIWARAADGLVPLADARYTKLVLYSSRTPQGTRDAITGSVSVPRGKPPKGGWPVITYAHGTTGAADVCAPSRAVVGSPVAGENYIDPDLNEWLRHGYAVVRTDYQGLGTPGPHPYLIGESEGRSVLDIVQAARQLDPRIGRRFLIAGHSQGGHAALFAAGEAKSWVPRLRLRGTVAFAPASHILDQAALLPLLTSPSGLTALAVLIIYGASTQSAQINIPAILSDDVLPFYPLLEQQCIGQLGASNELGGIPPSKIQRQGADLSALNPVLAQMNPLVMSAAPIFIAQGDADTTVFPVFTDKLKDELVGAGDQVIYKKYPGIGHGNIPFASEADAVAFFEALVPTGR